MQLVPPVSILLPIYKEPKNWIIQSIESMLNQTFQKFELLLLLDNPDDKSLITLLKKFERDKRVRLIINSQNIGLPKTLNRGIAIAKGKYIARLDADDFALPERLSLQYHFMETNPEIDLCGTNLTKISTNGEILGVSQHLQQPSLLKKIIPFCNVITHSTWFLKKAVFEEVGLYRNFPNAEDYDFVYRMMMKGKVITNLKDNLIFCRIHLKGKSGGESMVQKICFNYIKNLHQNQDSQVKESHDKNALNVLIRKQQKRYGKRQQQAQLFLVNFFHAKRKRNYFKASFFLICSFAISPIQRNYYYDWMKTKLIIWRANPRKTI